MNKKGSTILIMFMMGTLFFVVGLALAPALKTFLTETMNQTGIISCPTATDQQTKSYCTAIDMMLPLFVGIALGMAGFFLSGAAIR
jgi:hypothetical protein